MRIRTDFEEIIPIALLYVHEAKTIVTMVEYDVIAKFKDVIEENLEEMRSEIRTSIYTSDFLQNSFYFRALSQSGKLFVVIKPDADIKKAWKERINSLPIDIIIAANKDNALAVLGLKNVDGKLISELDYED